MLSVLPIQICETIWVDALPAEICSFSVVHSATQDVSYVCLRILLIILSQKGLVTCLFEPKVKAQKEDTDDANLNMSLQGESIAAFVFISVTKCRSLSPREMVTNQSDHRV